MSTEPGKQRRGCLFYGCLGAIVFALIIVVALFFVYRVAVNRFLAFTDTKSTELPKVEMTAGESESLQKRVQGFSEDLKAGKTPDVLRLSEKEINGMIATLPELQGLKDKVYVSIDKNRVRGQVSWPLDKLPIPALRNRYVNGEATFKVSLQGGVLIVTLDSLSVGGKSAPEEMMTAFRAENLAKDIYRDPKQAEFMQQLESVEVTDGGVSVTAKPK